MKLVLMGTNDFVVPVFDDLSNKYDIIAVFTRAPKPKGRKHILTPSPVHAWAMEKNLPVFTSIKDFDNLTDKPDFIIVISYGVILRDNVLNTAKCINVHPSTLPKYRGPSPIKTAILNGDRNTDVCLMEMNADLDTGDVLMRENILIGENDTCSDVEKNVSNVAIKMLNEYINNPGKYPPIKQQGDAIYTRKFTGADEIIDWTNSPQQIHNQIRALSGGRTKINGMDVKILETKIENGELKIVKLQPAGKNIMDWKSFINGLHGAEIKYGE
ncbi:MAG: methionyl-tRNA formyltransferase [Alphaproteobacteria bacterium]|nr:methionyl-tRNA formyltransferase [Alphaproteobacteria bacterium]